jgi:hypothetical protein
MATSISNNNDFLTKGVSVGIKTTKVVHGIMFDGAWNLLVGCATSTSCSFVAVGMKVHKTTGAITRGMLGAVQPASASINLLDTLIDGDAAYYYVISLFMCNQHTGAQQFYVGFKQ